MLEVEYSPPVKVPAMSAWGQLVLALAMSALLASRLWPAADPFRH